MFSASWRNFSSLDRRADIEHLARCRVHHPKDFMNVLRELAELLLARPQGLFGLLAPGYSSKEPHAPHAPFAPQPGGIPFECPAVPQFNFAMVACIRIAVK